MFLTMIISLSVLLFILIILLIYFITENTKLSRVNRGLGGFPKQYPVVEQYLVPEKEKIGTQFTINTYACVIDMFYYMDNKYAICTTQFSNDELVDCPMLFDANEGLVMGKGADIEVVKASWTRYKNFKEKNRDKFFNSDDHDMIGGAK